MKLISICRLDGQAEWSIISNMTKDGNYKASQIILANSFNEYVEWRNCGVIYRIVRESDLNKYVN